MHEHLIYEVQQNGDLMWFRHRGEDNGTFNWDGPLKVGNGWGGLGQVFGAGNGVVYGIGKNNGSTNGELTWYRHAGRDDGSFRWEGPKRVGTGWGEYTHVFSGGDGIIYAIRPDAAPLVRIDARTPRAEGGELVWFRHVGQSDGTVQWEGPKTVGTGWGGLTHVFHGGDDVIYAVTPKVEAGVFPDGSPRKASGGDLMWFRHLGRDDGTARWSGPKRVGTGWGDFTHVFAGEAGIVYAITAMVQPGVQVDGRTPRPSGGDLMWFRHEGRDDGSTRWEGPTKVGRGWGGVQHVFSGGDNHALDRATVLTKMTAAWNSFGGPKSTLGLPRGERIEVARNDDGYQAPFRGGDLHLSGDGKIGMTTATDVVSITLAGIECQIRQEKQDEVFGVISVIGPSGGVLHSARFPGSGTIDLGPNGMRIANLELPLITDGTVQKYAVVATLVENDSGDVDVIANKITEKISSLVASGLGSLTGVDAESVAESETFKEGLAEGMKFFLGSVFGIGDDPYNAETLQLDWTELRAAAPPPLQPAVRRDDDPRAIENWTHRMTLSGVDDGGDRGQYVLYLRVTTETHIETKTRNQG